jgi:hypothetical protein
MLNGPSERIIAAFCSTRWGKFHGEGKKHGYFASGASVAPLKMNKEGAMKRLKIQLGILIMALANLSLGYGFSRAAGQVAGDNVVVNQVTEEDLLIAGRNL